MMIIPVLYYNSPLSLCYETSDNLESGFPGPKDIISDVTMVSQEIRQIQDIINPIFDLNTDRYSPQELK